jgi:membrane-associated two-gene conflict system component 1 (EACC1)
VDTHIRITGGTGDELVDLGEWLSSEDELRGRIRTVTTPITKTELGSLPELLTVALGAGGAGTVLASSMKTWLMTRRTSATITVEADDRRISLDIHTLEQVAPLLDQILNASDDH